MKNPILSTGGGTELANVAGISGRIFLRESVVPLFFLLSLSLSLSLSLFLLAWSVAPFRLTTDEGRPNQPRGIWTIVPENLECLASCVTPVRLWGKAGRLAFQPAR